MGQFWPSYLVSSTWFCSKTKPKKQGALSTEHHPEARYEVDQLCQDRSVSMSADWRPQPQVWTGVLWLSLLPEVCPCGHWGTSLEGREIVGFLLIEMSLQESLGWIYGKPIFPRLEGCNPWRLPGAHLWKHGSWAGDPTPRPDPEQEFPGSARPDHPHSPTIK